MKADFTLDNVSEGLEGGGKPHSAVRGSGTELWSRFLTGDLSAMETIYMEHFSGMFAYALSLVGDTDMVKDAIQDIFMELWHKRANLGKVHAIRPYLYTILRRKVLGQARENGKLLSLIEDGRQDTITSPSPEREYILSEDSGKFSQELERAIRKLNKRQRELIHLKYHTKLNNKQIAEITELPYSKVCYHIKTALQQLQVALHRHRY